jgi:hypothetical protein
LLAPSAKVADNSINVKRRAAVSDGTLAETVPN